MIILEYLLSVNLNQNVVYDVVRSDISFYNDNEFIDILKSLNINTRDDAVTSYTRHFEECYIGARYYAEKKYYIFKDISKWIDFITSNRINIKYCNRIIINFVKIRMKMIERIKEL